MKEHSGGSEKEVAAILEREQQRLGQQLHDQLCQTLSATALLCERIAPAVPSGWTIDEKQWGTLKSLVERAVEEARALADRLNPPNLEGAGLMNALHLLASSGSPNCRFQCEKPVFVNDPEAALALLRIAQEGLRNAFLHAKAKNIWIILDRADKGVTLVVQDDGSGFKLPADPAIGSGIWNMQMRAKALKGSLKIESRPSSGTKISCFIPGI